MASGMLALFTFNVEISGFLIILFNHYLFTYIIKNGTLKIIDRKKHIFKLAQGEYIAPEKIENIYIRSEPVSQIYVHGDSLQVRLLCNKYILYIIEIVNTV